MLRRIRAYIIGLLLGMLLVFVLFRDRKGIWDSWLPEDRVIERMMASQWIMTPKAKCLMVCMDLSIQQMDNLIKESDVNFDKSDTQSKVKVYQLQWSDPLESEVKIALGDSTKEIVEIQNKLTVACSCGDL